MEMGSRVAGARRCSVSFQYDTGHLILLITRDAFEVAQFLPWNVQRLGKAAKFALLLLRILRCEIGYNFLETWVAAQRIPVRVQFQVTIA